MSRLAKGGWGANRANRANPPPSDLAPARQVTLQVTYGVGVGGGGANRANREMGGDPAPRESGPASGCGARFRWPW